MNKISDQKAKKPALKYRIELWAIFLVFLVVAILVSGKDSFFYVVIGFCITQAVSEMIRAAAES